MHTTACVAGRPVYVTLGLSMGSRPDLGAEDDSAKEKAVAAAGVGVRVGMGVAAVQGAGASEMAAAVAAAAFARPCGGSGAVDGMGRVRSGNDGSKSSGSA
jgi:hypothetical protein